MATHPAVTFPNPVNALRALRQLEHAVYHRLRSIAHDRQFVDMVRDAIPSLPLFANLRCGAWYHPFFDATCYFKSTDGHFGHWSFSQSRLNLHIAVQAAERGGAMIVDSTRKGKEFPDSLTRTIPIWAAVLNALVAKEPNDLSPPTPAVILPPWVPASEAATVSALVQEWAQALRGSGGFDVPALRATLHLPLRCVWVSPANADFLHAGMLTRLREHCIPLFLVSVSNPHGSDAPRESWTYIQGAGDDQEVWALGLTPRLFWAHENWLLDPFITAAECKQRVLDLVEREGKGAPILLQQPSWGDPRAIGQTGLHLAAATALRPPLDGFALVLDCGRPSSLPPGPNVRLIPVDRHHKHHLERSLPALLEAINAFLPRGPICIACDDGTAVSVSVAVAALALLFTADFTPKPVGSVDLETVRNARIHKDDVKRCLMFICSHVHDSCPDRNLMKQVNRFFMAEGAFAEINFGSGHRKDHQP